MLEGFVAARPSSPYASRGSGRLSKFLSNGGL